MSNSFIAFIFFNFLFKALFFRYDCTLDHAANPEASILWANDRRQFKKFATNAVRESRTQIYDNPKSDDPLSLRFKPWDASIMEPVLKFIQGLEYPLKDHPLNSVLSRQHNPFASFFNVEKASYLCEVIPVRILWQLLYFLFQDIVEPEDRKESGSDLQMDVQSDHEDEEIQSDGAEEDDV